MSLGACGDKLGITMGGVLALSMIQAPVMMSILLSYPAVKTDVFSSKVVLVLNPATNTSAINLNHPTDLHYMHSIHISPAFLVCGALFAFFAIHTYQITQQVS
jgi:hypothetical protein